jgi:hypothetical protein
MQMLLPCENDQAKPDPFSRLARSTNLSKILPAFRLSGAVWIEAQTFTPGCPRTCLRSPVVAYSGNPRRFCANPPNLSNFGTHVKDYFPEPDERSRAAQNINEQPAQSA